MSLVNSRTFEHSMGHWISCEDARFHMHTSDRQHYLLNQQWVDLALMCDNWYHHWVAGALLDDQLWHQALVMDHVPESLRGSEQGPNDVMMWTLLCHSVINADAVDKPWNGLTQSMRYSAVLVGQLWGLLAGERTRVSLHPSFQLSQTDLWLLPRGIVWSESRLRQRRI